MGHRKFDDIVGELSPQRRARIDKIKEQARADAVAFSLSELRKSRGLTQTALAQTIGRTQASVSALENNPDHLVSTLRGVIEGMGGRLELVAVFDDERIALPDLQGT